MTFESDIYDALKAVCTSTFPDFAPVTTPRPYITYQQIGGQTLTFLDPTVPSKKNAEMQINVWADTRMAAAALALQIEAALIVATAFQARPLSAPVADFDADMPVYGSRQDFSIWSDR